MIKNISTSYACLTQDAREGNLSRVVVRTLTKGTRGYMLMLAGFAGVQLTFYMRLDSV
jgi:hypothetical protein